MEIEVKFKLDIADNISPDDITEWLEFELNANGRMNSKNPLAKESIQPVPFSVEWDDLGRY